MVERDYVRDSNVSVAERKCWSVKQRERKRFVEGSESECDGNKLERLPDSKFNSESADILLGVGDL